MVPVKPAISAKGAVVRVHAVDRVRGLDGEVIAPGQLRTILGEGTVLMGVIRTVVVMALGCGRRQHGGGAAGVGAGQIVVVEHHRAGGTDQRHGVQVAQRRRQLGDEDAVVGGGPQPRIGMWP
jgi:hypothetical protein